jgi:hypothetical protein
MYLLFIIKVIYILINKLNNTYKEWGRFLSLLFIIYKVYCIDCMYRYGYKFIELVKKGS